MGFLAGEYDIVVVGAGHAGIEAALAGFPGALLVVSHDEAFLRGLTLTHEWVWEQAGWRCESL